MRRSLPASALIALVALAAAPLAGCGSSTKTVTAASTPPAPQTTAASSTAAKPNKTATAPGATTATTGAPTTTRTASGPAFAEEQKKAGEEGASAAAALVRAKGYTPNDTSEYHATQTLRVLVATRTGSGDGYDQRAFFFVDGRYIGTDAKEPSASVKVVSQSDTEVALAYPLYRPNDPLCCPGAGQRVVHFQLDNGKLAAMDPIPPAHSSSGLSRG